MRIVHLVDYLMPTMGYQEFLLPKWNARHGHEVTILTSDRYYPVPHYEQTWGDLLGPRRCGPGATTIEGVRVVRLPCAAEWKARPLLHRVSATVQRLRPHVLFCHGSASPLAFAAARIARRAGLPLFYDNHMTFGCQNQTAAGRLYYRALRWATRRWLVPAATRFYGVARECCDFLTHAQGVPADRVELLPLGVDTDLFRPDPERRTVLRHRHGIPDDAVVILQTGKLTPDKSPAWLAEAAAPLLETHPELCLLYLGAGGTADRETIGRCLPPAQRDRVQYLPLVPAAELPGYFALADICVYPNAASLSCLEAAACARPVIMADLPAGRWRADCGVGVTYRTGDIEALRTELSRFLAAPAHRVATGQTARKAVLRNFGYASIAATAEAAMADSLAYRRPCLAAGRGLVIGIDASNLRGGGGVTHLREVLTAAAPRRHGVQAIVAWSGAQTLQQLPDRDWLVKVPVPALNHGILCRTLWQRAMLPRCLRALGCDLLFAPGGLLPARLPVPAVVMPQNMLVFEAAERRRYPARSYMRLRLHQLARAQTAALNRADGVTFLTRYARDTILPFLETPPAHVAVVPHGIARRFFCAPRPQRSAEACSEQDPFRLLYVSIVDVYKHQWHVAEAVVELRRAGLPIVLDLVGPAYPPARRRLESTLARIDPAGRAVRVRGAVPYEDLHREYHQAEAFVFASSCENLPIILLEAMAAGLPIACSSVGPMPEVLGPSSFTFCPTDSASIAQALRRLFANDEARATHARRAYERACTYRWDRSAAQLFDFLTNVAGG